MDNLTSICSYDTNALHYLLICFLLSSGDSEVARIVIDESNAEGEEARKFLEDVRVTFPQVCGYNGLLSSHSPAVELLWNSQFQLRTQNRKRFA